MKIRLRSWKINSSDSWLHIDSEVNYEDIENSIPEDSKIDALASSKIISSMQKSKTQIQEIDESRIETSDDSESKEDYLLMIACCTPFEISQVIPSEKSVSKCKPLLHKRFNLHFIQAVSWRLSKTDQRQTNEDDLKVV